MKKDIKNIEKAKEFDRKLVFWQALSAILCFILIVYLFLLQVVDIKNYKEKAKQQRMAKNFVMRGTILDRNGIKLASDKVTYTIYAHPKYFYDKTPSELADLLSEPLNMSKSHLQMLLSKNYQVILLKKDVDKKSAEKIQKLGLGAVSIDKKAERIYPQGNMAAHILGYYNPNSNMSTGVEYSAKGPLTDVDEIHYEKTPDGNIIYSILTDPASTTTPMKGKTVQLTIDSAIQLICENELNKMVSKRHALRGSVVVMNPRNGEILAWATVPSYNPNNFKHASALQLKNWAVSDVYSPGSTFKVLTVASGIQTGKISPSSRILDTGKVKIGDWEIKNYDVYKHPYPGWIDLVYLFEHSSNVGSGNIAFKMSSYEFYNMLKKFGLGEKTGIDLPGESRGILPQFTKWDKATHFAMGYGLGASTTVIQMASAVSAIANGGVRVTPHVIKYSPDEAEKKLKYTQVLSYENARAVTNLLAQSIERSKADIKSNQYTIAAKTGTAQKLVNGRYTHKLITSIVGFFPASNPQVLIYVVIDSADGYDVWGSTIAAPVFKEIQTQTARIMSIAPDKYVKE